MSSTTWRSDQGNQLHPKPFGVADLDARSATGLKELAQDFVPERLDHGHGVSRIVLRIAQQAT
jgi:hypothetical protein